MHFTYETFEAFALFCLTRFYTHLELVELLIAFIGAVVGGLVGTGIDFEDTSGVYEHH